VGDTELLGLAVPWIPRQEAEGFRVEVVPSSGGRLLAEDFARAADRHTRMILLSSVQWTTGYRPDLAAFSELARRRDLLLVVDAIQQLGAVGLDVGRTPVDFLVCGGPQRAHAPGRPGLPSLPPRPGARRRPPRLGQPPTP